MDTSYKKSPHSVNGKSAAKYQSVLARAYCAALWRLYAQPRPPMWLLCKAYGLSQPTIRRAVRTLSNGNGGNGGNAKPLRHTLSVLHDAGIEVERVYQAGKHTEVVLEDGSRYRLPRGNHPSRRFERGLRSYIRKFLKSEVRP